MTSPVVSYFSLFMVPSTKWSIPGPSLVMQPHTMHDFSPWWMAEATHAGRSFSIEVRRTRQFGNNSKSAFIGKYHFSWLFNAPVLFITTKIPMSGFVVVIQEGLPYSITRHHSDVRQMLWNSADTKLNIMVFWEINNKISQTCIPVFLWFFYDAAIFTMRRLLRATWAWHFNYSSTRFELLHKMFHASFWYSESTPDITKVFSSSPKPDRLRFYTFFDWFSAHFWETKEKKLSITWPNVTKQNWRESYGSTGYWRYCCCAGVKEKLLVPENAITKQWVPHQGSLKTPFFRTKL